MVDDVGQARGRPVVVDDICHDALERLAVSDLLPGLDVLVNDLTHDILDVAGFGIRVVKFQRAREAAITQVVLELKPGIANFLAHESLHVKILGEGKGEHLELDVTPRELGHVFAGEQVGVGSRDEDREPAVGVETVQNLLEALDVLNLVNEQVLEVVV